MEDFEKLLAVHRGSVERFVRYRLSSRADADDVLQEIYLTAYEKFSQLKNKASFQAWLLQIAKSKCNDYYRKKAVWLEIPMEELPEKGLSDGRYGASEACVVRENMSLLTEKDRRILELYYWRELSQAEIAQLLRIPVGTVKSRLYTAKQNFKKIYPHQNRDMLPKEGKNMKRLPEILPEYTIVQSGEEPFAVKWEELMGWFLVPRLGEKLSWACYDMPSRACSHVYDMEVTGKARVHGVEGVELTAREAPCSRKEEVIERTFVAQLTDTHCRYLAALRNDGDVRNYITFLDGEAFMPNWGFGEDNVGNMTNLSPKGDIRRNGNIITSAEKEFLIDIVGRYTVTIGGKSYDTVCVIDIETYNCGVVSEQFLDRNGRTILWRRYNRDDWKIDLYGKRWSERLPENERLIVNGTPYVQWYDCITDYIL